MTRLYTTCSLLILFYGAVKAQQDTTIIVPKEAWKRYFENSSNPNHSPIDDHRSYHNLVIATDRPDQTESPYLVPKNHFQIEMGAWFEKGHNSDVDYTNSVLNTTLWKYGLTEHFELRLITEYLHENIRDRQTKEETNHEGFNSVAIGSKIFICEEHGLVPKVSLITHLQLPYFGTGDFRPNNIAPRFRFTLQKTLTDRFTLSTNLGSEWDGNVSNATLIYTLTLGINLVAPLAMYVELYGFMTEDTNIEGAFNGSFVHDHRFDGGFTYVVTNDFQLDISGGVGITDISPDYFLSMGFSWRFPKQKIYKY